MAAGDLARRRGQLLQRAGDLLGERQSDPDCREDHHQRHQHHRNHVIVLERLLQDSELAVLVQRVRNPAALADDLGRDHATGHHQPDRTVTGQDRRPGVGQFGPVGRDDRAFVFGPGQHPFQHVGAKLRNDGCGLRSRRACQERQARRIDRESVQTECSSLRAHARMQVLGPFGHQQRPVRKRVCNLVRLFSGPVRQPRIDAVDDLDGTAQRPFDAQGEPVLDGVRQKPNADQEQQQGREQRDGQKRQHQPRAQVGAGQLAAPFVEQLQQIAADQEDEQDEQDDVEVDEQDEDHVVDQAGPVRHLRRAALQEGEDESAQRRGHDDRHFPALAAFRLRRPPFGRAGWCGLPVRGLLRLHGVSGSRGAVGRRQNKPPCPAPSARRRGSTSRW